MSQHSLPKVARDNRANQLNPRHPAYHSSRAVSADLAADSAANVPVLATNNGGGNKGGSKPGGATKGGHGGSKSVSTPAGNWPSTTGKPSGGGRGSNPPKK